MKDCQEFFQAKFGASLSPSLIIYMRAPPTIAWARIQRRKRGEELKIGEEYIRLIHDAHEEWLNSERMPKMPRMTNEVPIIIINAEVSLEEMPAEYEKCFKDLERMFEGFGNLSLMTLPCFGVYSTIRFQKLLVGAIIPRRGTAESAGLDLFSPVNATIPPYERMTIDTGIEVELPARCYGRIADRSSVASGYGVTVGAGVIDPDYRGSIRVVLFNHSSEEFSGLHSFLFSILILMS